MKVGPGTVLWSPGVSTVLEATQLIQGSQQHDRIQTTSKTWNFYAKLLRIYMWILLLLQWQHNSKINPITTVAVFITYKSVTPKYSKVKSDLHCIQTFRKSNFKLE
jgi:hypothetical protein